MSLCRRFLIVLLLALSLPVQSFAAVSVEYAAVQAPVAEMVAPHEEQVEAEQHILHIGQDATLAGDHRDRYCANAHHSHHAHLYSTCASCCLGVALPSTPAVPVCADVSRAIVPLPPSAGVVSFLTEGIERPPRHSSV
ncbi:MAG: hypothetical protein KGQ57_14900 [Burkholderiales bacterium]|nr:hypothetical protein [Burkholderiales bacterium]